MLNVEFMYSAGLSSQLRPDDRPDVVFSGRSNVGKSSLINKLCNRKALARVSSKPGKTATINFYDAGNFNLVDLPGYGYAKVSKAEKLRWSELVEGYFAAGRDIALVVQIIDMRHKPTNDDVDMIRFMNSNKIPYIIVCTKSDKLNKKDYAAQMEMIPGSLMEFGDVSVYPFSALSGVGTSSILSAINRALEEKTVIPEA